MTTTMYPIPNSTRMERTMSRAPNYYIVDAEALPEIFRKVVEARRLLDTGEAETVNQAVRITGISRSAF